MRTSVLQYEMMVEFMEANGDLSKPSGGPRGRNYIQGKWKELTIKLNSEGTGDSRSEEKWRKVWSDYKNNCKKKCAKINRAISGTGGGPALQLPLTDLESRVMQIIGVQAATGMVVEEAGFPREEVYETSQGQNERLAAEAPLDVYTVDWNTPSSSSQPTVAPPPPPQENLPATRTEVPPTSPSVLLVEEEREQPSQKRKHVSLGAEEEWKPPQKKKDKSVAELFLEVDGMAKEFARERDRAYEALERERLHIRKEELRVRELKVQSPTKEAEHI